MGDSRGTIMKVRRAEKTLTQVIVRTTLHSHASREMRRRSSISAARSAARSLRLSGFPRLVTLTRHMTRLTTVEAVTTTTAATARLSWLLGFLTLARHVSRLATVEAIAGSAATTAARLSWFLWLFTVTGHMAGLAAVEAILASSAAASITASATLLAPADSYSLATKIMTIEVTDCLLSVLFLVEVYEPEGTLYSYELLCDLL